MKAWIIGLFVLLTVTMPRTAWSQSNDATSRTNREFLHGVTRVCFIRSKAEKDITKDGLDTDAINLSVENKLRLAGLTIEPMSSLFHASFQTRPQLVSVEIETIKIKDESIYCYTIRFEVTNYALLLQNEKVLRGVTIWEQHRLGYIGTNKISLIKDICDKFTDKFINDWLRAQDKIPGINPKTLK